MKAFGLKIQRLFYSNSKQFKYIEHHPYPLNEHIPTNSDGKAICNF